jgi:tRNA dimethylallyltransferase
MGPTASGKTELALALCDLLPLEIISVDSALIYRGMDIGTAKPSLTLQKQYKHHLIDILDPLESYSAAAFRRDALAIMAEISSRGRVPLLVGGTMLYYRALQQGLAVLPDAQPELRRQLEQRWQQQGLEALHKELQKLDPAAAVRIHPNDPQRILRALEVVLVTGKSMTELWAQQPESELPYRLLKLALWPQDRMLLHARIARRFEQMLAGGFIAEVQALKNRGDLSENLPSMRSVGYRQVWQHLAGELDYEQTKERGIIATRQLAKRQLTWLRAEPELLLLDMLNYQTAQVSERVRRFIA